MFRNLSIFSKIMFISVAALLIVTVALGISTAVKESKGEINVINNTQTPGQLTNGTPNPSPTSIVDLSATPEPTKEVKKYVIALDPGQQKNQDKDLEPVGPGASTTVEKMSYGATSVTTKEREYIWTMRMAELIKSELVARGYDVVLVRESNDDNVSLSNSERAQKANEAEADIFIGIQQDAHSTASVKGIYVQAATDSNPYIDPDIIKKGQSLGQLLHDSLIDATEANDRGFKKVDTLAIVNWAKMPTAVVTLGYTSNKEEDTLLQSEEYQQKLTGAICDAIDAYFKSLD